MTNEQQKAKELAILLTAFADGKQLEYKDEYDDTWHDCTASFSLECMLKDFANDYQLRVKPETKRIEYNYEDDLVGKVVIEKGKSSNVKRLIQSQDKCSVLVSEYQSGFKSQWYYYNKLGDNFTFLDGTPCYKEVECE